MLGQWFGELVGDLDGQVRLEIDDEETCYIGSFQIFRNENLPQSLCNFSTTNKAKHQTIEVALRPLNIRGELIRIDHVAPIFGAEVLLGDGRITLEKQNTSNEMQLTLDVGGRRVRAQLRNYDAVAPSELVAENAIQDWQSYKAYVQTVKREEHIFRGQSSTKRLRTPFHRTRRSDLWHFIHVDLPRIYRYLSPLLTKELDFNNPDQVGSFMNLLQHHGFPMPLLDWTLSPYIAAFFAFRFPSPEPGGSVRIFQFDGRAWHANYEGVNTIAGVPPHITITELPGVGNIRMLPQQSVHMVTNIDDIESFVLQRERDGPSYLKAFDIPNTERGKVLSDLRFMGITAATLFPGLDGSCEALKNDFMGF